MLIPVGYLLKTMNTGLNQPLETVSIHKLRAMGKVCEVLNVFVNIHLPYMYACSLWLSDR